MKPNIYSLVTDTCYHCCCSHRLIKTVRTNSTLNVYFLLIFYFYVNIYTLKRNKNATLCQWKIYWALFKVLDRDNEPSNFQEMLMDSRKSLLEIITN